MERSNLFQFNSPLYAILLHHYDILVYSIDIRSRKIQELQIQQLKKKYVSRDLIEGRLNTMCMNNYLKQENEKFYLTRKGNLFAKAFQNMKLFWRLGHGG